MTTTEPTINIGEHSYGQSAIQVRQRLAPVLQSAFGRFVALVALILLSPLLLVTALAIRLSGPGPILFRQERIGRDAVPFMIRKFRTMVPDADAIRLDLLHVNDCDEVLFKMRLDPRVTPVGRWIRRFSIDELPQLWNVVIGDMALVGPRPALRSEVDVFEPHVHRRHVVKPGVTGLWQVSGRSDLSWEETVALDLDYVDRTSLRLDLVILLRTIPAVLSGRGAY